MPKGYEFSQEIKQLMFNVIEFVENEKNGSVIPLNNVNDRLQSMLGISMASVERLRKEMREEKNRMMDEQKKFDKAKQDKENQQLEMSRRFRHARSSSSSSSTTSSSTIIDIETTIPVATPPRKFNNSGRPTITLSEEEQENIRYHVHLTLAERIYPTVDKVLFRIVADNPHFPIRSRTSLWRWMKKLGFEYKRTSKVVVPLDTSFFMAARARYFTAIDELRTSGAHIFWHDETWCNKNEEKRFVWTDGLTGSGRLRHTDGKGTRLVISALMTNSGFHVPSIDIFECDEDHSMNHKHFVTWIDRTSSLLRKQLGDDATIVLVIDNAPWHNRLTEDTMPAKRSWRKEMIIEWLKYHRVSVPTKATKAELLELASDNLPEKRYVVDEAAAKYDIKILRLPIKHCILNPIELAWASMKGYVRDNNVNFRLSDVRNLAQHWMVSVDTATVAAYLQHVRDIENTFKKSDSFAEQIEEEIIDEDEELNSEDDEDFD